MTTVEVQGANSNKSKGVYPQSDGVLAIVDIDASEGFIGLWVHLFVVIEGLHRNGYRRKRYFLVLTEFKHVYNLPNIVIIS